MTLVELKYIVALARERHFGRAAQACFVSQPTLSVSIKKIEEELGCKLFERTALQVTPTNLGEEIIVQAQKVLQEVAELKQMAQRGKDPLSGPLRLGVIHTIGPYLLPDLVRQVVAKIPQMSLILQENFTNNLLEQLRSGEIDCAILAQPFEDEGLAQALLYDEPFMLALPRDHALAKRRSVSIAELAQDTLLLLGAGHCLRDHVLEACSQAQPAARAADSHARRFEGSSLETIKHMVAAGMGFTVVPLLSVPQGGPSRPATLSRQQPRMPSRVPLKRPSQSGLVRYLPFEGEVAMRRVVLVWRRSFTRFEAIVALRNAVVAANLRGVTMLT